jgi:hypothetical protein
LEDGRGLCGTSVLELQPPHTHVNDSSGRLSGKTEILFLALSPPVRQGTYHATYKWRNSKFAVVQKHNLHDSTRFFRLHPVDLTCRRVANILFPDLGTEKSKKIKNKKIGFCFFFAGIFEILSTPTLKYNAGISLLFSFRFIDS